MGQRVPNDILKDILVRLPVKSLIRFRCVSKSWDSIIPDPTFITEHFKLNLNQSESLISTNTHSGYLLYTENRSLSSKHLCTDVCNSDGTLTPISRFEIPSLFQKFIIYSIVGFCNGLFCLASQDRYYRHIIYLWNPSIRKFKELVAGNEIDRTSVVGLAYNSQNNDFKVVRLLEGPAEAEIYSLSTDSWRTVVIPMEILRGYEANFGTIDKLEPPCIFLNGALHTVARTSSGCFILSFDVNDDSFRAIEFPNSVFTKYQLALLKGSLAVIAFADSLMGALCDIWVMEEYGVAEPWTRKYTVPRIWGGVNFYGCTGNGELLIKNAFGWLVSIDLESQSRNIPVIEGADWVGSTTNSMESLILLDGE